MNYYKGLDGRYWNGVFPPGYEDFIFAGIKISQGTSHGNINYEMPRRQWKLVPEQGRTRMPFHFWKGTRTGDPEQHGIAQAEFFFDTTVGLNLGMGELPPVIDVEDKWAQKGLKSVVDVYHCVKRTEELWGQMPTVYTATWCWNQWIYPYDRFDGGKYKVYDITRLWEADPPPDTKEPGEYTKNDLAVIQVELDASYPGFNAKIDIDWADKIWYDEQVGNAPPPPTPGVSVVEVKYDSDAVEIKTTEVNV